MSSPFVFGKLDNLQLYVGLMFTSKLNKVISGWEIGQWVKC